MTKEEFNKLWKDSTREEILNQYYYDYNELQQKENIIKEVREILNNKRTIMTTQLLNGIYCNYEELLYQVDEEIRKILDKGEQTMNKEIYIIYYNETETSKKYIETIYRNSVSDDSDMGDAIEFDDKETAQKVAEYLNKRKDVTKYKVMCIKTTFEEIE